MTPVVERLRAHGLLAVAKLIAARHSQSVWSLAGGARRDLERRMLERGWHIINVERLLGREHHRLPICPVHELQRPEDIFWCRPLSGAMPAGTCVRRQALSAPVGVGQWKRAAVSSRLERCRNCALGRLVADQIAPTGLPGISRVGGGRKRLERRRADERERPENG